MLFRDCQCIERCRTRRIYSSLHVQVFSGHAANRDRVTMGRKHPAQKEQAAGLNCHHVSAEGRWRIRQMDAEPGKPGFRAL